MALGLARLYILWVSEKRDNPKIAVCFENDDRYPCFKHAHMMVQEQRNVITPSFPAKKNHQPRACGAFFIAATSALAANAIEF